MAKKLQLQTTLKLVDVDIDPKIFQKISRAIAGIPLTLGATNTQIKAASRNMKDLAASTASVTPALEGNARAARLFLQRMTQFAILLPTFATLNKAIQGSVGFLVDLEAEVKKIISLDIQNLSDKFDEIADSAIRIGKEFRISAAEAAKGITLFIQAGFSLAEAQDLAAASALAAKVSTLDVGEAQEFAIAATKIFGDELGSISEAFDKIIKVEDLAAVGAQDIAEAFRTGGNALAFATKSFEDTIGLISALREQTRKSGREVGTFFKTLATRITAAGEAQNAVRGLGIEVQNLDGSLRPLAEVLVDIKGKFDGMTEAQQSNISKSIAGVRQFESFLATINSLDTALSLSAQASEALGTAQQKNEIIATSLTEKLAQLRIQGQELALAISEAGIGGALNQAVTAATKLLSVFTDAVKMADKIGISVTPLIALFGSVSTAAVLGFGGGFRNLLGGGLSKGGAGGGAAGGADVATANLAQAKAAAQAAISLEKFSQVTEVMRFEALTGTKQQRAFNDITLQSTRIIRDNISSTTLVTKAQNALAAVTRTTLGRIAVFTAASLAAGAAMRRLFPETHTVMKGFDDLSDAQKEQLSKMKITEAEYNERVQRIGQRLDESTTNFSEEFGKLGGSAIQTGAQFALLHPLLGVFAGGLTIAANAAARFGEEADKNKKAFDEAAKSNVRRGGQEAAVETLAGFAGEIFVSELQKFVKDRTGGQFQNVQATAFGKTLDTLGASFKALVPDAKALLELVSDPSLFKKALPELLKQEDALFANQQALAQLRAAYDANGNLTISVAKAQELFYAALGRVEKAIDPVTKELESLIFTFAEFEKRFATQKIFQELQELNFALEEAGKAPEDVAKGVDKLSIEAQRAAVAFEVAQKNFEQFSNALLTLEADELFGEDFKDKTKKIFADATNLARLPAGAGSTDAISKFLAKFPDDQAEFVKKFISAERERFQAQTEAAQAAQAVQVEIFDRNQKLLEAEKEAAINAQKSLDEFNIGLLEFGGDAQKAMANISKLVNMTDVEKAQMELASVSAEATIRTASLNKQISDLDSELAKVADGADGTEKAFKRAELTQKRNELLLEKEDVTRKETIDTIKARIDVGKAENKASDEARKKAEKMRELLLDLAEKTDGFNQALRDAKNKFVEFELDKLADLATKEADALEELKTAQQDVLSATVDLDAAYKDFIQAVYDANDAIAEAQIRANSLQRQIDILTGGVFTFQGRLEGLTDSFRSVLEDANISLAQRIQLEQQLAEETLNFLQQARDEIVNAGLGVFGQSSAENNALQQGIAGLTFIAEQLGGSFENFLNLSQTELANLSNELLNLPLSLRQQILDALQALPSTATIGGFSVDQLKDAIGQIGAGVAPEVGLPSIEELTNQQVEQLKTLQDLALKDAQLQFAQVAQAQEALDKAEEQLEIAKIQEERSREHLEVVREGIQEEVAVLNTANVERQELTAAVIAANDRTALRQIEKEAQLFAEQNKQFHDVGQEIIQGIGSIIAAKLALLEATKEVAVAGGARGYIPNFSGGNLSPGEAAGLLRAASREKRNMPAGAGLAVANTSEAIIPMRNRGFVPHFDNGNLSPIAAGIEAIKQINETVVAAIAQSVTQALSELSGGGGDNTELLQSLGDKLSSISDLLDEINTSNTAIQLNTEATDEAGAVAAAPTTNAQDINVTLSTNGQTVVTINGLEALITQIRESVHQEADEQVEAQLNAALAPLIQVLQERGLLSGLGQAG